MKVSCSVKIKTQIFEAGSDRLVRDNPWKHNLILDSGLNAMARRGGITGVPSCSPAQVFQNLIIGSGTNPTSTASGAITFTQSGTTITASGGFFTSGMVGAIFKYGTGTAGVEYYITSFTDATHVTVDTSATVGTPTVGTVWFVAQTALQSPLSLAATSYRTLAGDNSTSFTSSTVTFQRTFVVAQQASPYTVNEIGYNSGTLGNTTNGVAGRIVLSSSDSIGTSNYYVVIMQLAVTYAPASPASVGNVGTNIDTSGTAMIEAFGIAYVNSDGTTNPGPHGSNNISIDGGGSGARLVAATTTFTQNSGISSGAGLTGLTPLNCGSNSPFWNNDAGNRGRMTLSFTYSTTTSGQTIYGFYLSSSSVGPQSTFDILLTTPFTAPTGVFSGTASFALVYDRILNN